MTASAIKSVPVKSIKIDKSAVTLDIGKTYTIKLIFTPANTTQKLVKYSTSNKNVATVDAKGKITAVKAGKAVITVVSSSNKKISAICNITVQDKIDPLGKYKTPITLTAVSYEDPQIKYIEGEDLGNNVWTRSIRDELGIQIKYLWIAPTMDVWRQKMNIALATNALPDFVSLKDEQYVMALKNKQLADITDVYNKYKTDSLRQYMEQEKITLEIASSNNRLYSLPRIVGPYDSSALLWIREDWMKNLGLKQPKTMADVVNIIKAFTNNDPDKNNKKDTYGLALNTKIFRGEVGSLKGFFEGYHAYVQDFWIKKDGGLQFGGIQPEVKTALAALANLFKEGCIDPEFGVKTADLVSQDFSNNKLGLTYGPHYLCLSPLNTTKENSHQADFTPSAVVSNDAKPALTSGKISVDWYYTVNKKYKYPEAIIKIANFVNKICNSDYETRKKFVDNGSDIKPFSGVPLITYGDINENYTASQKIQYAMKSNDTSKLTPVQTTYYEACKRWTDNKNVETSSGIADWGTFKTFAEGSSWQVIGNEYIKGGKLLSSAYYGATTTGMGEKSQTLEKLQVEIYMKIITGHEDISAFDKFVDEWKKIGGDQITSEVNEWYKSKNN
jgi:Bacterial surface proteins containing Ig-like domains